MQMVRTTLRLEKQLKKEVERLAVEKERTFQNIYNEALRNYLKKDTKKKASKILKFYTQDLGIPLNNLTRSDYYDESKEK